MSISLEDLLAAGTVIGQAELEASEAEYGPAFNYVHAEVTDGAGTPGPQTVLIQLQQLDEDLESATGPIVFTLWLERGFPSAGPYTAEVAITDAAHEDQRNLIYHSNHYAVLRTEPDGSVSIKVDVDLPLDETIYIIVALPNGRVFPVENSTSWVHVPDLTSATWHDEGVVTDVWLPTHVYDAGDRIIGSDGHVWRTGGGTSGTVEPDWENPDGPGHFEGEPDAPFVTWDWIPLWEALREYYAPFAPTVQPDPGNGHWYTLLDGGTSGASQPTFPTDGSDIEDPLP